MTDAAVRKRLRFDEAVRVVFAPGDVLAERAAALFPALFADGCVRTERLEAADAAIMRGEQALCLVERKTLADLAASRTDGRWESQRARMHSLGARIIYAVEADEAALYGADPFDTRHGMSNQVLRSMLRNAQLRERAEVVFTPTVDAMVRFVLQRVWPDHATYEGTPAAREAPAMDALTVVARRAANMDPPTHHLQTLAAIPHVGEARARLIAAEYATPRALERHMRKNGPAALTALPGIGPAISTSVYEYTTHLRAPKKTAAVVSSKAPPKKRVKRAADAAMYEALEGL